MSHFSDLMPPIDPQTAGYVNYIFDRLGGIIPSLLYAKNDDAFLSTKREYTYALMDAGIRDQDVINFALNKIRDDKLKYLPTPGEFVDYCNRCIPLETNKQKMERYRIERNENLTKALNHNNHSGTSRKISDFFLEDHSHD